MLAVCNFVKCTMRCNAMKLSLNKLNLFIFCNSGPTTTTTLTPDEILFLLKKTFQLGAINRQRVQSNLSQFYCDTFAFLFTLSSTTTTKSTLLLLLMFLLLLLSLVVMLLFLLLMLLSPVIFFILLLLLFSLLVMLLLLL